jgi:FkbM family methyltransferase
MVHALKHHPSAILLDIGSHLGQYGIVAASMHRTVVAVDANPDNIRHLRASVRVNGFENRMHIYNLGVDRTGGGYVRVDGPKDNTGGWSTTACKNNKNLGCVPTTTVDNIVTQSRVDFNHRFILKIDIEGNEPAAIAGARKVLAHTDVIFMEWSKQEGYVQMFDQLQSHGFQASCNRADECPWDVVWTRV